MDPQQFVHILWGGSTDPQQFVHILWGGASDPQQFVHILGGGVGRSFRRAPPPGSKVRMIKLCSPCLPSGKMSVCLLQRRLRTQRQRRSCRGGPVDFATDRQIKYLVERKHAPLTYDAATITSNLPAGAAPSCRAADMPGGKHCGGDGHGCARGSSGGTMGCGINGGVRPTYAETRRRGAPGPPPRVEMRRPPTLAR